ncbi:hypothetical protein GJA_4203 [Janthinobacterium agaricidamnosum NBRC 102515 = DSM 9628]|uniref:Uncharacterized protein n=1 Tax=Janthinobacterium agaricidamnosum NBRC 102515 = DSM 9628 TaxID=1349767 RepID=W0VBS9_9BURK|nr:hypothetical protein [Janthinobacterium agaricidamnosum]CDG84813.1 hypothetical protein GJA_4203 [Janthinobacterium agaricidamnosum NBRC 102515 = DSM 9628]
MEAIDPDPTGRENGYMGGGYLSFRRIYMGSDSFKPMGAQYAGLAPAGHEAQRGEAIAGRHPHPQQEAQKTA